jgi:hypothetical protein
MRVFHHLTCGCYISCDNGCGLILCSYHAKHKEKKGDPLYNYLQAHVLNSDGLCPICHQDDIIKKQNEKAKE